MAKYQSLEGAIRHVVCSERARLGHNQASFARTIGWSQANLSDYECARRGIGLQALARVAKVLGMPLSALLAKAEEVLK